MCPVCVIMKRRSNSELSRVLCGKSVRFRQMTVPYCAIKKGRRGRGVELNTGYFLDGVKYCRAAESEMTAPSLFDLCGVKR